MKVASLQEMLQRNSNISRRRAELGHTRGISTNVDVSRIRDMFQEREAGNSKTIDEEEPADQAEEKSSKSPGCKLRE